MTATGLVSVKECIDWMRHACKYEFKGKLGRACYVFRDMTGTRPLHIREMTWTLGELRSAFLNGW